MESLPDIPRWLTALAEWGACVVYVAVLARHGSWLRAAITLAVGLGALLAVQWIAGQLPIAFWGAGMLVAIGVMYAILRVCVGGRTFATLFIVGRAILLAEFVASLQWQLQSFFRPTANPILEVVLVMVVYGGCLAIAGFAEARHFTRGAVLAVNSREVLTTALIAAATFLLSNISFVTPDTPFSGRLGLEVFYIRTLVDLCGFVALYAQQEHRVQLQARISNVAMNTLLRSQHQQYLQSKQSIDQVNRRYHDMKNQIDVIRAEQDPALKAAYLDELDGSIQEFSAQRRTGSAVLDILLTAKGPQCSERGIQLTCVADGTLLGFISVIDITSIFGNALDNAIESASRVPETESRLIRVAVFAQNDLLMIRIENTFDGQLRVVDGQPRTIKADRAHHGYGLRNIRAAAEKYGGIVTFDASDSWFSLRVLVPLPTSETQQDRS